MKFTDMSEEQKAEVLDRNRDLCVSNSWWYEVNLEEATEDLAAMGFNDADISFSGFSSQGDGASFTTKNVNVEKILRHFKVWSKYRSIHNHIRDGGFTLEIYRFSSHYVHDNTISSNETFCGEFTEKQFSAACEVSNFIQQVAQGESYKIYRKLESTYDDMTSDDYITDHIEANDYSFCPHHYTLI